MVIGSLAILVGLLGPLVAGLLLLPDDPIFRTLATGNVFYFMLGAAFVGFRHPAAWSFVLLTKVARHLRAVVRGPS